MKISQIDLHLRVILEQFSTKSARKKVVCAIIVEKFVLSVFQKLGSLGHIINLEQKAYLCYTHQHELI